MKLQLCTVNHVNECRDDDYSVLLMYDLTDIQLNRFDERINRIDVLKAASDNFLNLLTEEAIDEELYETALASSGTPMGNELYRHIIESKPWLEGLEPGVCVTHFTHANRIPYPSGEDEMQFASMASRIGTEVECYYSDKDDTYILTVKYADIILHNLHWSDYIDLPRFFNNIKNIILKKLTYFLTYVSEREKDKRYLEEVSRWRRA